MNWIKNRGSGYSSAGKTLENILGKDDDIASLPDFQGVELKTKVDGSEPYIGLFSMVPDSQPLLINKILKTYGQVEKIGLTMFFMHKFMEINLRVLATIFLIVFLLIIKEKK